MSSFFERSKINTSLHNPIKIISLIAYFLIFAAWLGRSFLTQQGIASVEDMTPFVSLSQLLSFVFGDWFEATQSYTFRSKYFLFLSAALYSPLTGTLTIFLTTLAGLCHYLSIYLLLKLIIKTKFNFFHHAVMVLSATNVTLFVVITHISNYYSLGFGISLMCLCISLFIFGLLSTDVDTYWKQGVLGLIIVVFLQWTASPHLLFLFFFSIGAFTLFAILLFRIRLTRVIIIWVTLIVFYVLPFGYFIINVTPISAAADATFVTYSQMNHGSVIPLDNYALSFYSLISLFVGSDPYPHPQPWFIFQSFLMLSIFVLPKKQYLRNRIALSLLGLYLLSIFFSVGLKSPISGYNLALDVVARIPNSLFKTAIMLVFNTLRFPFRWMYLLFFCWGIFLALFGIELSRWINSKFSVRALSNSISLVLFSVLIFIPYLGKPFSLSSTFSGNYGVNFSPITLPRELVEIRSILHQRPLIGKLVIWPSPGSERVRFGDNVYQLNDTFYNIFFDVPALLGTFGTPHANFLSVQLGYQLAEWGEPGVGAYLATQGVEYLIVREDSLEESRRAETSRIRHWLKEQPDLELVYEGHTYDLFHVRDLENTLLSSKAVTFYVASVREPTHLLQDGVTPSSTAMIDLSAGEIDRETIQMIRDSLPSERVTFYFPNEDNRMDALISTLAASNGTLDSSGSVETLKQQLELIVVDYWYPKFGGIYTQFKDVFGRYGALQGKAFFLFSPDHSASLPLEITKEGQYAVFVKAYSPSGSKLRVKLDRRPDHLINLTSGQDYRYIMILNSWLKPKKHHLDIELIEGSAIVSAAYGVLNSDLKSHIEWFDEITHDFSYSRRADLIQHIDSLPNQEENSQVFYLSKYIYDPGIKARIGEELLEPLPAWYSQIAYISSQSHTAQDFEILMNTTHIRLTTITYMVYMLVLCVLVSIALWFFSGFSLRTTNKTNETQDNSHGFGKK